MSMNHALDQSTGHANMVRGSEVFVGGLARTVTENKIIEEFSSCGEILEIRLIKDHAGNPKGYCFIRFGTKQSADKAIKDKSGIMFEGKKIGVLPSTEQDALYLGNIHKEWSADEFGKILRQAFPEIVSVDLALPFNNLGQKQKNRGFAIVKFSSHAAAARAHRLGSAPDFLLASLCHPVVQWAEPEPEIDLEDLAKIKTAFVRNIPPDADENFLERLFEPFGKVDKVVVSKKTRSPVGFVYFTNRTDLDKAIKGMNGKAVKGPGGGAPYSLLVELARPIDKNKKRARDEPQTQQPSKMLTHSAMSKAEPVITFGGAKSVPQEHTYFKEEKVIADPYEAAVLSLPETVKERLLRILRLGIASRFDIGIHSLASLRELPVSTAISILDQFMLSGADKRDKAEYLSGLISRHQVTKLEVNSQNLNLSRMAGSIPKESHVPNFSSRVHLPPVDSLSTRAHIPALDSLPSRIHVPAVDPPLASRVFLPDADPLASRVFLPDADPLASRRNLTATDSLISRANLPAVDSLSSHTGTNLSRYDSIADKYTSRYPSPMAAQSLSSRLGIGRMDEPSPASLHQRPVSPSSYSRVGLYSSPVSAVPSHQPTRPKMRFDPYTGEPYKFDPFTGEPIVPESLPRHSPSPF